MKYSSMTSEQLVALKSELTLKFNEYKNDGVKLDMARGKPGADQLAITNEMLTVVSDSEDCLLSNGTDCRNYGGLDGLPECRELFAKTFGIKAENIIIGGNSSLNMMFDTIARAFSFGFCDSVRPWSKEEKIKFLCPVPGYDRHFAICELFGIEMINIPLGSDGPDVNLIKEYVENDDAVKGMWCVPKYSNPSGIVYSDEVIRAIASLKPKATDFRLFWDNAYAIHDLYDEIKILDILSECEKAGNPDMPIMFASTSKVTFPGAGVAFLASSIKNINQFKSIMTIQTIGPDKINQLRHLKYFKDENGIFNHMKVHADILRPKFEAVLNTLQKELGDAGIASWTSPKGGYFISFDSLNGCASKIYNKCIEAGLTLTNVGATFPYGKDPDDSNIRIAPSFPSVEQLTAAVERFVVCVKLVSIDKILSER